MLMLIKDTWDIILCMKQYIMAQNSFNIYTFNGLLVRRQFCFVRFNQEVTLKSIWIVARVTLGQRSLLFLILLYVTSL